MLTAASDAAASKVVAVAAVVPATRLDAAVVVTVVDVTLDDAVTFEARAEVAFVVARAGLLLMYTRPTLVSALVSAVDAVVFAAVVAAAASRAAVA